MHLTNYHFYNTKNYLYCKSVKGLSGFEVGYRFAFNGKERDDETYGEGNAYDFEARIQDSRLSRWLSLDPLQAKYPGISPFNFCNNNPIALIDPDGKSPIYVNGLYMGTDNQGFKGEILIMSKEQYLNLNSKQKDNITFGTFNHTEALGMSQTLGQKIDALSQVPRSKEGITRVDKEVIEINNIINNVVSKTKEIEGYEVSKLHNGKVSSVYDNGMQDQNIRIYGSANDGNNDLGALANTVGNKVTFNLQAWGDVEKPGEIFKPTVENLQNTYVHEAGGHFIQNLGSSNSDHAKVVNTQKKHSTWDGTTKNFKNWINTLNEQFTTKKR